MAEMTIEEIKATYPANTVYLSYDKGGHINGAIPFDIYAERKKTYSDCCEKMKVERVECTFKEVQDADLYGLSKLYQKRVRESSSFGSIKFVLENTIEELQETLDDMNEIEEAD